jgi:hypothetical protein
LGIPTRCLIGFELDFAFDIEPLRSTRQDEIDERYGRTPQQIKQARTRLQETMPGRIYTELSALTPSNEQEASRKQRWIQQIGRFTLEELIMYKAYTRLSKPTLSSKIDVRGQLLQTADRIDETAEFRFGPDHHQEGYYDNPGDPEIRTLPARPVLALTRHQRIVDTFSDLAREYGALAVFDDGHTSMSLWNMSGDRPAPLHDLHTSLGLEIGRRISAGILIAIKDAMPSIISPNKLAAGYRYTYAARHTRIMTTLRVLPDRYELRRAYGRGIQADRTVLAMIGGAVYGLRARQEATSAIQISTTHILEASEAYDKARDRAMLRALQHSPIDGDGIPRLDAKYPPSRNKAIMENFIGALLPDTLLPEDIVRQLLATIRLQGHTLVCNEQAFTRWKQGLHKDHRARLERASPQFSASYVTTRLQAVRRLGLCNTLSGSLESDWITVETWHTLLQRYAGSAALQTVIPQHVRHSIVKERAGWFSEADIAHEKLKVALTKTLRTVLWETHDGTDYTSEHYEALRTRIIHQPIRLLAPLTTLPAPRIHDIQRSIVAEELNRLQATPEAANTARIGVRLLRQLLHDMCEHTEVEPTASIYA